MRRTRENLIDRQFGYLTVIDVAEDYIEPKSKHHRPQWVCRCVCGNIRIVTSNNLRQGVKSCGCKTIEQIKKANRKHNVFDLSGDYGVGYTAKGEEFWFDKEDYHLIKNYYWRKYNNGYFVAVVNKKTLQLHRLIMHVEHEDYHQIVVDHRNGSSTLHDNRKSNLRVATRSQNNINALKNNNTSGCIGVYWHRRNQKWVASINDRPNHHKQLGEFANYKDAVKARKEAEQQYYGDYVILKSRGDKIC